MNKIKRRTCVATQFSGEASALAGLSRSGEISDNCGRPLVLRRPRSATVATAVKQRFAAPVRHCTSRRCKNGSIPPWGLGCQGIRKQESGAGGQGRPPHPLPLSRRERGDVFPPSALAQWRCRIIRWLTPPARVLCFPSALRPPPSTLVQWRRRVIRWLTPPARVLCFPSAFRLPPSALRLSSVAPPGYPVADATGSGPLFSLRPPLAPGPWSLVPAPHPAPTPRSKAVLVALIDRQHRLERAAGNLPHRLVVAVGVAVGREQAIHELEQMTRHPQRRQSVLQPPLVDRRLEQLGHRGRMALGRTGLQPGIGQVVERLAGPLQRANQVLLVQAGPAGGNRGPRDPTAAPTRSAAAVSPPCPDA